MRGVRFGRPEISLPENFGQVYELWVQGEIGGTKAAGLCGMPTTSFYRKANKQKERQKYQCRDRLK